MNLQSFATFDTGWVAFCDCEVFYDGRASSVLARGNYLLVYKPDKSISIHGSTITLPRNYLANNSKLTIENNQLIFTRKNETVAITVHRVLHTTVLPNWSDNKIAICRTERELAIKLFNNWNDYFDDDFEIIELEFATDLGPIDIIGFTLTKEYVVELKRKRILLKDVTQLRRYLEARGGNTRQIIGYMAAPEISKNALKYLKKHNLNYLQIKFD